MQVKTKYLKRMKNEFEDYTTVQMYNLLHIQKVN